MKEGFHLKQLQRSCFTHIYEYHKMHKLLCTTMGNLPKAMSMHYRLSLDDRECYGCYRTINLSVTPFTSACCAAFVAALLFSTQYRLVHHIHLQPPCHCVSKACERCYHRIEAKDVYYAEHVVECCIEIARNACCLQSLRMLGTCTDTTYNNKKYCYSKSGWTHATALSIPDAVASHCLDAQEG